MRKLYDLNELSRLVQTDSPGALEIIFDFEKYVVESKLIQTFLSPSPAFYFFIDFTRMRYLYMSEGVYHVMGYTREEWMKKGLDMAFDVLVEEDRNMLHSIHQTMMQIYYDTPQHERKELKFSYDFRVKRKDGKIIRIFEQSSFIAIDSEGKPLIVYCIANNISDYKAVESTTLTVSRYDQEKGFVEIKKEFPLAATASGFSPREMEVLRCIADGLSSKQTGDKLFISRETVSIHRKNLLKKTGSKNTAELLKFCYGKGYLKLANQNTTD